MQHYTVDLAEGLNLNFTTKISNDKLQTLTNKILNKFSKDKNFKLQGFRAGKIPLNVVKQYRGQEAYNEALNDLINLSISDFSKENSYDIGKVTDVKYVKFDEDLNVHEIKIESVLYPVFDKHDISKLELEVPEVDLDESLDKALILIRKQHSNYKSVDRAAEANDKVLIDFEGYKDGEKFSGGTAENFSVVLGEGRMIPEFESAILGHKAGDEFESEVNFPEDYHDKSLSGQKTTFKFKLKEVEALDLVDLDAALIKKVLPKINNPSVDTLKEEIIRNVSREIKLNISKYLVPQIINQIVDQYEDLDLPISLLEDEINNLKEKRVKDLINIFKFDEETARKFVFSPDNNGDNPESSSFLEDITKEARAQVIIEKTFSKLVRDLDITVSDEELKDFVTDLSIMFDKPAEYIKSVYSDDNALRSLASECIQVKLISVITEKAKTTKKDFAYEELMTLVNKNNRLA